MVLRWTVNFASTRSAQIATLAAREEYKKQELCLHTLRADCNRCKRLTAQSTAPLPPHAPRRLQHLRQHPKGGVTIFASTRSAQIATRLIQHPERRPQLCLHTLRADCNNAARLHRRQGAPLPPHAPRRLQRKEVNIYGAVYQPLPPHAPRRLQLRSSRAFFRAVSLPPHAPRRLQLTVRGAIDEVYDFASTRSAQIATSATAVRRTGRCDLCLHTLRADCNGRNAQNCNIHFSERVLSR